MSKLFKLKRWLTVADAAKHLSTVFGEEVTEADVFRFALEGTLKLSVNVVNGGRARPGELVPISEAEYREVEMPGDRGPLRLYGGPKILTDGVVSHVLVLEKYVASISGLYDIPMIGGDRIAVENEYQQLAGGPEVTTVPMDGAFLETESGKLCQLQDDYEDNEYMNGSKASWERYEWGIEMEGGSGTAGGKRITAEYAEDRKKFLQDRKSKSQTESFYAGGNMPEDIVYVVRTKALADFINSANEEPDSEMTPEEWRTHVAKVLAEHNGNKTHAGKALGISAERVRQLTQKTEKSDRKPFALSPQDPFGIARKPASNKGSRK
jgi:hypothetical protein